MGRDVVMWSSRALERQHTREMQQVYRRVELADVEVRCIAGLTKRAIGWATEIDMTRELAERIAPGGAEAYALLEGVGVREMALAIGRMTRGW